MPYLDSHGELDISMRYVLGKGGDGADEQTRASPVHACRTDGRASPDDMAAAYDPAFDGEKARVDVGWRRVGELVALRHGKWGGHDL